MTKKMALSLLVVLCCAMVSQAATVDISASLSDPGFDNWTPVAGQTYGIVPQAWSGQGTLNGWVRSSAGSLDLVGYQAQNEASFMGGAAGSADSGNNYLGLYMNHDGSSNYWFKTDSTIITLNPGDTYTLSFKVRTEGTLSAVEHFLVTLQDSNWNRYGSEQTYYNSDYNFCENWQKVTYTYTYTGSTPIQAELFIGGYRIDKSGEIQNRDQALAFDTFEVPEPATLGLLCAGLLGSIRRRK
jgi:hypothetical protein